MKSSTLQTRILASFKPAMLSAWLLLLEGPVTAQTFTTLYNFNFSDGGFSPDAGLVLSGNTLYGTTFSGGSSDNGTVFAVKTDGTGFTILHSFTETDAATTANSDGCFPAAGLILSGNTLYGTASGGGSSGAGTVFKVNTDGTGFTTLHSFRALSGPFPVSNSDGAFPHAELILSGNTLYGTAINGGSSDNGTVFAVNTDGTGFTTLHSFTGGDGANPDAGLVLSGSTLYGTASAGGGSGNDGTVFAVNIDGTGFTTLHSFSGGDGANPLGLILSGNTLYGTAAIGTSLNGGLVFAVNTDGTGFATLHSFRATSGLGFPNSEGANPLGLILSGNTLFGTASEGGPSGWGTVFAVNTDGRGFTTLYSFSTAGNDPSSGRYTNSDGAAPIGSLILSDNILYGTTREGGSRGFGTVFNLSAGDIQPPVLSVPGTITVNATSPAGAVVTFSVTAVDNVDPNPTITSSPASGSTFPIGTTHVTCTATDASGNEANAGFDVVVLGASQQTTSLISMVQTFNFVQGINNSLDTKLQDAQAAIAAAKSGDLTSTCGYLGAFINEVQAQSGKKITASQASQLIAAATQLKAVVGCP